MTAPTVACLVVTRATADRLPRLARSLADYARQTWPVRRLVLVAEEGPGHDPAAARAMALTVDPAATVLIRPADAALGHKRNAARDAAAGAFTCQWDDDDRHHPERIAQAMAAFGDAAAVALGDVFHLVEPAAAGGVTALGWLNWAATPTGAHPGTLLARPDAAFRYPETGAEAALGEDSRVALDLKARGRLAVLAGAPHLYVYVVHGANAWPSSHHAMLARTLGVSQALLRRRQAAIRTGLAAFDLGPLAVAGPNGAAFTLDGVTSGAR